MSKSNKMYKNVYYIGVSGMRNGVSKQIWESYYVGANNEKHALEIIKKYKGKTQKYQVHLRSEEELERLGIPKIMVGNVLDSQLIKRKI